MEHRRGQHKAKVFAASLGLTIEDADELRQAIQEAIRENGTEKTKGDNYGQRYVVDFEMQGKREQRAVVRSTWIIRADEDFPRLTSCYVR